MKLYRVIHEVLPSKINPIYSGDELSISTFGKAAYFSKDEGYLDEYLRPWLIFSIIVSFEVEGSILYLNESNVIRDDEGNVSDIFYESKVINAENLATEFIQYDLIELDLDDKNIVLLREGQNPKVEICEIRILSENVSYIKRTQN